MPFANPEAEFPGAGEETYFGLTRADILQIAEMLILGIVAVLIILLVIRPLVVRAFEARARSDERAQLLTDQSAIAGALPGPAGGALVQDLALEEAQADDELEQMIDINRVEGRVKASSLRRVGEIVQKHPEAAVSIIRSWLYQET
jgi:flagellar M-ring protein FliF